MITSRPYHNLFAHELYKYNNENYMQATHVIVHPIVCYRLIKEIEQVNKIFKIKKVIEPPFLFMGVVVDIGFTDREKNFTFYHNPRKIDLDNFK